MCKRGCYDYCIDAKDIDFTGKATYIAMTDYILKAAGDDADNNGFGVTDLNQDNCSWVLSRMCIEFGRRMEQYEKFTVRTWVNDVSRMMTTRNMIVTDSGGERLAAAVTQWAVIDLDKRTALDIREHIDYSRAVSEEQSPMEKPKKITHVRPTQTGIHKVVYSDLDFNNHVHSMKYLEWMFDMLPLNWIKERKVARMDINFLHEARYGELLAIGLEAGESSLFEITKDDGLPVCKVALAWR